MFHAKAIANSGGSSVMSVSGETMHFMIELFFLRPKNLSGCKNHSLPEAGECIQAIELGSSLKSLVVRLHSVVIHIFL